MGDFNDFAEMFRKQPLPQVTEWVVRNSIVKGHLGRDELSQATQKKRYMCPATDPEKQHIWSHCEMLKNWRTIQRVE